MSTAERETFLEAALPGHIRAERAMHNGDLTPRLATWSHGDDVTLFGAGAPYRTGWHDIRAVFDWLAARFTSCEHYGFELMAADASGDLAFITGLEHYRATTATGDVLHNTLRATHVFRREGDGWKIVHRHGDHPPEDVAPSAS
jgi:ketosteroid isomerase-like protein